MMLQVSHGEQMKAVHEPAGHVTNQKRDKTAIVQVSGESVDVEDDAECRNPTQK